MYFIPPIIFILAFFILTIVFKKKMKYAAIYSFACVLISFAIVQVNIYMQTIDTEIWSGYVTNWKHVEEFDEWHPPKTYTTKDSKGKTITKVKPGYYEHHYAENSIQTTDNGWFSVDTAPDGRDMNDRWPNSTKELEQLWPYHTASASSHSYQNKVQASYSIYRHKSIDVAKYKDIPEYPDNVHDYINIDRIIGYVPKKAKAITALNDWNTELNKSVPNPEKPGKMRSWKQVNVIFVNVGDKPEEYGFALQDKWENGNKNDFIVAFSMKTDGTVNWVYPFSWSETEILKLDVRDMMLDMKKITDFSAVVDNTCKLVADKFVRKQFADFNYLQVEFSTGGMIFLWVANILMFVFGIFVISQIESNERVCVQRRKIFH